MYAVTLKTKFKIAIITSQNEFFNRYVIVKITVKINFTDFHIKRKNNMSDSIQSL